MIVAVSVVVFFNPIWVAFEQDRTGVAALLGYTPDQVRTATNAILGEFAFGPGTFAVEVNGQPVLNEREQGHMADVRRVVTWFAFSDDPRGRGAGGGVPRGGPSPCLVLAVGRRAAHCSLRPSSCRPVCSSCCSSTPTFEIFHRLLFPAGSYSFDPLNERLVQLFPMTFWSETSIALSVVLLGSSLLVAAFALRRVAPADARLGLPSQAQPTSRPT